MLFRVQGSRVFIRFSNKDKFNIQYKYSCALHLYPQQQTFIWTCGPVEANRLQWIEYQISEIPAFDITSMRAGFISDEEAFSIIFPPSFFVFIITRQRPSHAFRSAAV
jgi:hypothetical protein